MENIKKKNIGRKIIENHGKKQKFIRKSRTFNRTNYKKLPRVEKYKRKQRNVR